MCGENEHENPISDPARQTRPPSPAPEPLQVAARQGIPGTAPAGRSPKNVDSAATARELHWLEKLSFAGQLCLVIVGIIAACIYGRQSGIMKSQLE